MLFKKHYCIRQQEQKESYNYSDLESVILWILGAFWYGLCLVNAYRIRKVKLKI
ncbi:MAG: hypothetical protein J6S25_03115 [Aeriscardovia sp.]|nr:hypothetical protein [Aeriscardovia sp.]